MFTQTAPTQSPPIQTIDAVCTAVDPDESRGPVGAPPKTVKASLIKTSELATELGCTTAKISKYKGQLIKLSHRFFRRYKRGAPLTEQQADVIRHYRSLIQNNYRGKVLSNTIKTYPHGKTAQMQELEALLQKEFSLSGERLEAVIKRIVSIFAQPT